MGWRVAAAWALIGFASQCFLAAAQDYGMSRGFEQAMIHYVAWGAAGYLVGTVCQRIIEDSFRDRLMTATDLDDIDT